MSRTEARWGGDGDRWGRGRWDPFPESCAAGWGVLHGEGGRHTWVHEIHGGKEHRAETRERERVGCLTLLSFSRPPGLDHPWNFIRGSTDRAAFCNPLPSFGVLSLLPRSSPPCLLRRHSRGCSEPRVKPKNVSPKQVLLCSTILAPAWRPPAHPHSPGSREGSEPAGTARPRVQGNSPWRVRSPREQAAGCSVPCPPPSFASLSPRAPRGCKPPDFPQAGWRGGSTAGSSICRKAGMCSPGSCSAIPPSFFIHGNSLSSRATQGCLDTGVPGRWDASARAMRAPLPSGCATDSAGCAGPRPAALGRSLHPRLHCSARRTQISPVLQLSTVSPPRPEAGQGDDQGAEPSPARAGGAHRSLLW